MQVFAITSSFISVTFNGKALETISGAASGGTVVITAGVVARSALSDEDRERVQGRPVYDFSVTTGSQQVSDFEGGTATVINPLFVAAGRGSQRRRSVLSCRRRNPAVGKRTI